MTNWSVLIPGNSCSKMLNKRVKFQLDSGSDLTLINLQTWKRLGKPTMIKSSKLAKSVTGGKLNSREN